jgi:glyoxylase-like metal-dependent hydrolase (beta-lactamase superfamily II)
MNRNATTHARYTIDCDVVSQFTAAYLRVAKRECAFIEAHTSHALPKLLDALAARGLHPADVRYVVVTHAHLDHASGASALLAKCPNATLLAHPRAARHLIDPAKLVASATSVYGAARFAELYGTIEPIAKERVRALEDGESFELGDATLRVHHTAGHAKHHFVIDDPALSTVYTGDTFGLVYPALQRGVRFAIATTSPTDFDPDEARKSIERVLSLGESAACLTHFDEVRDLDEVASQLRAWIDRSESWLEEAAQTDDAPDVMTAKIAAKLKDAIAKDAASRGLALGDADWKLLALDVELNAQGIAFVADKKRRAKG